jgi:hypothetical protein
MYKNGTSQGTVTSGLSGTFVPVWGDGSAANTTTFEVNFGQRPFVISSVPAGHKALCTSNLPDPTIVKAKDHFNAVIYTGASPSDKAVTGVGFSPNLTWIKARTQTYDPVIYDSVRGATKELYTSTNDDEITDSNGLKSFDSDGFTVGSDGEVGDPTGTRISWNWKESASAGFDIVAYSGSGASQNIAHNLGVAPEVGIFKKRNDDYNWFVYTELFDGSLDYLQLNLTTAKANSTWSTLLDSASNIQMEGDSAALNASGDTYIAYLFASVEGFSKCGYYDSIGSSTNAVFIYTGFKPRFIMIKNISSTADWHMYDTARGDHNNVTMSVEANTNAVEQSGSGQYINIFANGFKPAGTSAAINASGDTYFFMAFAENSLKSANAR